MPPYLFALIGAFVFAIAHGMHFTVAPLPGAHAHVTTLIEAPGIESPGAPPDDTAGWVRDDVRLAGIGY
jgi:hypothetical protein